jgi:hypothetical protein
MSKGSNSTCWASAPYLVSDSGNTDSSNAGCRDAEVALGRDYEMVKGFCLGRQEDG